MQRRGQPHVYFVRRADGEGPVKIGCSQGPMTRLAQFTYWVPYPLALVAQLPGDEGLERRFHAKFLAQHTHSEWFRPSAELNAVIAEIVAGTFDPSTLPEGVRLRPLQPPRRWTNQQRHNASLRARINMIRKKYGHWCIPTDVWHATWRLSDYDAAANLALVEGFLSNFTPPERAAA